jgi:ParB family chromosome partitioning protein
MSTNSIVLLNVKDILPHPNNPRKDLGDLTELAESIKARGVLQNLTVVPSDGGKYTVVIGHRRRAAAQLAGLKEVPCAVREDMGESEQIAAMLLENIQRNDLTAYEQAQGFQMMLDLGDGVGDISEQTGFSGATIRRRVKLLELDQGKFAESVNRGGTFADYEALNKIEDVRTRNKVLETIGTGNFAWNLKTAVDNERRAKNKAVIMERLKKIAEKIGNREESRYQIVHYVSCENTDFKVPDDAETVKYYYTETDYAIRIYKERAPKEKPKKTPEQIEREGRIKQLKDLFRQAFELRLEFAKGFVATGKNADVVYKKAVSVMFKNYEYGISRDIFRAVFDIEGDFRMAWEKEDGRETYEEALARIMDANAKKHNAGLIFRGVYCALEGAGGKCIGWSPVHEKYRKLAELYDFMTALGYAMSDEETALMDGTHKLYDAACPDTGAKDAEGRK